jgi:hypothetical protein
MKLKVHKLNWKQKVDKLRRIVLSGPAIEELPPGMLPLLEAWRAHTHGKFTDDEYMRAVQHIGPPSGERLIWEPYSDERGEVEALYGWQLQATIFGINGQPWWFVKAHRENAIAPTEQQFQMIEKVVELLGCHDTERDLIQEFPDEEGRWTMFWSWFHTGPLLEIHFHKTRPMLVVNEGTPLKDGYTRMERISRKHD